MNYFDAGVDKEAGYREVQLIKDMVESTYGREVLSTLGGFSGLYQPELSQYENPVFVSGTDGVGTKLFLAQKMDCHHTVGIDAVAMCVNDILCQGAKPLFFLDYIATGKLIPEKMASVVKGIVEGCKIAHCALIGGETAEMPGMYSQEEYDIAGFCVGLVERKKIITGENIQEKDIIIGLPSSGIHSNGYSLVRKILDERQKSLEEICPGYEKTLGEVLLTPTKIYTPLVLDMLADLSISGMVHITGGGVFENLPRILPKGLTAKLDYSQVELEPIFSLIQEWGNVEKEEMYRTFNMGVGFLLVISPKEFEKFQTYMNSRKEKYYLLGRVEKGEKLFVRMYS